MRMLPARVVAAAAALALLSGPMTPTVAAEPTPPPIPALPGLPIPSLPTDLLVPRFIGAEAPSRPLPAPPVPQHPYLSPNGTSSMHNDAYSTDAYDVSGPVGRNLRVRSRSYGIRECATIAFDSRDRLVGLCGGLEGFTMTVIDPVTLNVVDELRISARDLASGANPLTDICGGTYFFLDPHDHAFATTTDSGIAEVEVAADGTLTRVRDWPMASYLSEDDCLVATGVDWSGRLWWFSQQGVVGTLDRASGQVHTVALPAGEGIFNSISSDETGGMYLVTTHATYRLDAAATGAPEVSWRIPYDRGTKVKPGMLSQGSGTSPTLIGRRWIAIADNAEPRSNVIVYDRRLGVTDRRHCQVPVLANGASTTENSLVAAGKSLIIENNYGYSGVQATLLGRSTTPGMARVMIDPDGCHVAWTNSEVIAPTSVAKASLGNGLVYAYTKPVRKDLIDAWYVTAIDIRTGKVAWSRLTGTGIQWNNHYAAIYLGPDGTLYVATVAGLVRLADG
ncbi:hypothetical protein [Nocardioides bizhenqiangii]|uniref:PQQ-binding-like beta-propeller repeat protein n=1 Tax=Nocardioides bizhenqiangii TaxID=3095076 RepID=A0ABZ0ZPM2_9ACTN|nr:hypothetical protein [Nocardioides sp. HM61]WQQ26197.1 hypothetical protein SHK19_19825 [Nocardioides sp. HM61]